MDGNENERRAAVRPDFIRRQIHYYHYQHRARSPGETHGLRR
jgi:hypothetical protein